MLEKLTITGGVCFGEEPLIIHPFRKVNFLFGPNGSGKTTISRALAGGDAFSLAPVWCDSSPMSIKVYNRDFVDKTLRESNRIPGVFVLGDKSVEAEERLDAIERDGGERARTENLMGRARSSLTQVEQANSDANDAFRDAAWETYKNFTRDNPSLRQAFSGTGGVGSSKQALVNKLSGIVSPASPAPTLDSLVADADAVFDTTAIAHSELPLTRKFDASSFEGYRLLRERVVGSGDVSLSELIGILGNSDWIAAGRTFLDDSKGVCPFCQQKTPENLLTDLAVMFDDQYASQCEKIDQLAEAFTEWAAAVIDASARHGDTSAAFLDDAAHQRVLQALKDAIATNTAALEQKKQNPSVVVEFDVLDRPIAALDELIEAANGKIREHNVLIENRRTERPKLADKCWRYLAEVLLGETLATFKTKQAARETAIDTLSGRVTAVAQTIVDLDAEVRELHHSVESTRPVINQINSLLEKSGFASFKIVESPSLEDGYMLSRGDGELQEHSLSEGERTFIAFLYYFHLLDGRATDSVEPHRILAVIDDPISSLDSDVLFVVGALVRHLIQRAESGVDRIEQVFVLTHNVYFHKEISHVQHGEGSSGRAYFLIQKRLSAPSTVTSSRKNPVTTEYRRLWDEVKRALDGEQMSVVGLENVLRRILESYFRVMGGGIWDDEITPLLTDSERHVFRALFRWVNDGSHSIFEDVYYAPSLVSQDLYLQVFQRIFEVTKHGAHYKMMIHGKQSISEPEYETVDVGTTLTSVGAGG